MKANHNIADNTIAIYMLRFVIITTSLYDGVLLENVLHCIHFKN